MLISVCCFAPSKQYCKLQRRASHVLSLVLSDNAAVTLCTTLASCSRSGSMLLVDVALQIGWLLPWLQSACSDCNLLSWPVMSHAPGVKADGPWCNVAVGLFGCVGISTGRTSIPLFFCTASLRVSAWSLAGMAAQSAVVVNRVLPFGIDCTAVVSLLMAERP